MKNISLIPTVIGDKYISHICISDNDLSVSVWIMEKNGNAFCRVYWYNDDNTTVYLDCLNVNSLARNKGIGKELQIIREDIGVLLGATYSCLWVNRNTWMYKWYKRRGYVDYIEHSNTENAVWMRKELNKSI